MTRASAIELLGRLSIHYRGCDKCAEAFDMAIKALEHRTNRGDNISRRSAIELLEKMSLLPDSPDEIGTEEDTYISKFEAMDAISDMPSTDRHGEWIPVCERLPECEQEVLICTERKILGKDAFIDSIITPAIYEDGTMLEVESRWHWEDIDFEEWNDTEDCGVIPEGWFENRHFNPDDVYNNPVHSKVVAWMPLPKPYKPQESEE